MTAVRPPVAPGPRGHPLLGSIPALRADPLGLVTSLAQDYGDVVRVRLGPFVQHLLNHPEHVVHVLQSRRDNYDKATRSTQHIRRVCGESLLTATGETWARRRRLVQPAFQRDAVRRFVPGMVEACEAMLAEWQVEPRPVRVVSSEMSRLTYTIVARALFRTDVAGGAAEIEPSMRLLLEETFAGLQRLASLPGWVPTPRNRRFRSALAAVDRVVGAIVAAHRGDPRGDLLTHMLAARDPETGAGLHEQAIRNEVITLLIAGHETTANAITWTLHLLAQHAEAQDLVRAELETVLGGRAPTADDLAALEQTRRALLESMRLFPPIWIMERHVLEDDVIGGYGIPAGSAVVLCPWTLHRHPEFWEEPETFRPARFAVDGPPAYLPFGAGPRTCIGRAFALQEALIVLAMLLRRYRVTPVPGARVEPFPGITLPPRGGLSLALESVA